MIFYTQVWQSTANMDTDDLWDPVHLWAHTHENKHQIIRQSQENAKLIYKQQSPMTKHVSWQSRPRQSPSHQSLGAQRSHPTQQQCTKGRPNTAQQRTSQKPQTEQHPRVVRPERSRERPHTTQKLSQQQRVPSCPRRHREAWSNSAPSSTGTDSAPRGAPLSVPPSLGTSHQSANHHQGFQTPERNRRQHKQYKGLAKTSCLDSARADKPDETFILPVNNSMDAADLNANNNNSDCCFTPIQRSEPGLSPAAEHLQMKMEMLVSFGCRGDPELAEFVADTLLAVIYGAESMSQQKAAACCICRIWLRVNNLRTQLFASMLRLAARKRGEERGMVFAHLLRLILVRSHTLIGAAQSSLLLLLFAGLSQ